MIMMSFMRCWIKIVLICNKCFLFSHTAVFVGLYVVRYYSTLRWEISDTKDSVTCYEWGGEGVLRWWETS